MNQELTDTAAEPAIEIDRGGDGFVMRASGVWVSSAAQDIEQVLVAALDHMDGAKTVALDVEQVQRIDTVGAVLLGRLLREVEAKGASVSITGAGKERQTLIEAAHKTVYQAPPVRRGGSFVDVLEDIGTAVLSSFQDLKASTGFLGSIVVGIGGLVMRPRSFRGTPLVFHLEQVCFRALPIIGLISFVVGAIVSQQSIFQLRGFGAEIFVVDLIGILTVRELGVLLTAIMMAGRSGSAFTAEIGSMKMREEIDALHVMALDPISVLILPRILALIIGLTLMAFLASLFSILGGGVVAWVYGNIGPEIFLSRLKETLTISSFMVGMIKAPFMGVVIGVIACVEGLRVEGSAESLGERTTASVVKGIFVVIVLDGLFAMFFAALGW
jgi:phospholipid/cholesterol/gamma-HCH transport system permease protein